MVKSQSLLEFPYFQNRPMLTARVSYGETSRYFRFLIDSGADFTIISKSSAILLGVDLKKIRKEKIKVELANLSSLSVYKVKMVLEICDVEFEIPVLIADGEVENLLGRRGVFDKFTVSFKEYAGKVLFDYIGRAKLQQCYACSANSGESDLVI